MEIKMAGCSQNGNQDKKALESYEGLSKSLKVHREQDLKCMFNQSLFRKAQLLKYCK